MLQTSPKHKEVFRDGKKNRVIDLNSTTTGKGRIEVTQIKTNKARLAQIELLNKLNKCRNPFIIIKQEPYCYKSTLSLLPQNAKTMPSNRQGHPRVSISASNRLHMEEITELSHRDLVAGLVTLEGKKNNTQHLARHNKGNNTRLFKQGY